MTAKSKKEKNIIILVLTSILYALFLLSTSLIISNNFIELDLKRKVDNRLLIILTSIELLSVPLITLFLISLFSDDNKIDNKKQLWKNIKLRIIPILTIIITNLLVTAFLNLNFIFKTTTFSKILLLNIFILSLVILIVGLEYIVVNLTRSRRLSFLTASCILILMLSFIFLVGPLIEGVKSGQERERLIGFTLKFNPLAACLWASFEYDLLRSPSVYKICPIGPYYPYAYHDWKEIVLTYFFVGLLLYACGIIIYKLRKQKP